MHITILWHQVTGVPKGTFSNTPRATSLSRPRLTSSCQCTGTGIGLWQGLGVALGSIERAKGGLVIIGRVWCSHVLNELEEYKLSRYSSILCLFASVAGNGSDVGLAGGWDLVGQEHDLMGMAMGSAGQHLVVLAACSPAVAPAWWSMVGLFLMVAVSWSPGKLPCTRPRSLHEDRLR